MNDHPAPGHAPLIGFELETIRIPVSSIIPLKQFRAATKKTQKFLQIAASIRTVGVVEPLVVSPVKNRKSQYYLLDGLLRLEVLKEMGEQEVECLVSTDDEAYTYNKRISRLASVQEHKMVVLAMERWVPPEKLAAALNLEVVSIKRRFRLMAGVCREAEELLSDKPCPMLTFEIIKKMKPLRQVEVAELMIGQQNYSSQFARALLHATQAEQLVSPKTNARKKDVARDQILKLERELSSLQTKSMFAEETFGIDNLVLTVAKGYLAKLIGKPKVAAWLGKNTPEYLAEFRKIAETANFPGSDAMRH
jgi:hypothetical protein